MTGRTKTEVRDKLKKLQAEADVGLKTSASYTVSKAVDDWAAEALDGLADKTVRSHVDVLRPVTMLIGQKDPQRHLSRGARRDRGGADLRADCIQGSPRLVEAGLLTPRGEKRGRYYVGAPVTLLARQAIIDSRNPRDNSDPFG